MSTFAQLQLSRPIVQAPMAGGPSSPQLVAAVSNAGGLGSFACGMISPQQMREGVSQIRSLTSKPFAHEFVCVARACTARCCGLKCQQKMAGTCTAPSRPEHANASVLVAIVSRPVCRLIGARPHRCQFCFWYFERRPSGALKQRNVLVVGTANCAEHLQAWEAVGADAIVVQGLEAGGHRGGPTDWPLNRRIEPG